MLCLDRAAIGQSFRLSAERPAGFDVLRAYDGTAEMVDGPSLAASGTGVAVVRAFGCIQQRAEYVDCGGFIDGYDALTERFCEAHESAQAGAVLLVLDGPGGDAAGCEQAVLRMAAAAAASGKPTLVYIDERAASAHYWIAAVLGTGGIYLPPSGFAGSIGCMSWHTDWSGANAIEGVLVTYFSSPAGKVAGNPDEPLSDLARSRRQASVDQAAIPFVAAVAAARGLAAEAVMALDGAVLMGADAVAAGLADGLATFEEVVSLAAARASAGASLAANPTPAPATPAPQGTTMAIAFSSPALLALLALPAEASSASIEAAALPRLTALHDVMAAAGDTNIATLAGTVKALALDAAKLPGLQVQLDASAATSEAAERIAALEGAVASGKLLPAEAWAWDATGKIRSAAPDFAAPSKDAAGQPIGMPLAQLQGFLARKVASPIVAAKVESKELSAEEVAKAASTASLTPEQLAFISANKMDPAKFAALHASNFGGAPAAKA